MSSIPFGDGIMASDAIYKQRGLLPKYKGHETNAAAIVAAATWQVGVDYSHKQAHGDANQWMIVNMSGELLELDFSQGAGAEGHVYYLPSGSTFEIDPTKTAEYYRGVQITNKDAANQVEIGEVAVNWGRFE